MSTKGQCAKSVLLAMALSLVIAGCGPNAMPTPMPTPGPATIPFPTGTFTRDGEDPLGGHMIDFEADGSTVYQGHGRVAAGTYTLRGDQIVFKDNYCGGVLGTYIWSFDGSKLSFKTLDDTCADRPGVLHLSTWERTP